MRAWLGKCRTLHPGEHELVVVILLPPKEKLPRKGPKAKTEELPFFSSTPHEYPAIHGGPLFYEEVLLDFHLSETP